MIYLYVIYRPVTKDHPGKWVVRRWHVSLSCGIRPEANCTLYDSLDAARGSLPPGLGRAARDEGDDDCIEETWI
ncbi:MAG: hypothetical protein WC565_03910 [Parcubacteria group bacterium]|jgi:hypothetical protein